MLQAFVRWWYGPGWFEIASHIKSLARSVFLYFSIPQLLRNLFAPWRRIISPPGRSLDEKWRATFDNLISRSIGFIVRILVLIFSILLIFFSALVSLILAILWPLIPVAVIYFLVRGVLG